MWKSFLLKLIPCLTQDIIDDLIENLIKIIVLSQWTFAGIDLNIY